MNSFFLLQYASIGVATIGVLAQLYHIVLVIRDRVLLARSGAEPEAIAIIDRRIGVAAILSVIHLAVASSAGLIIVYTASSTRLTFVGYWAGFTRILVSSLVILSTALSLNLRQRLLKRA